MRVNINPIAMMAVFLALSACSGGSDKENDTQAGSGTNLSNDVTMPLSPDTDGIQSDTASPSGSVTHYAAVTVADGDGTNVDLSGSFFKLESGASAQFLLSRFSATTPMCKVQDERAPDINDLSVVYLPDVPGVSSTAVSAGESIVLTSADGDTYATLFEQRIGDLIFYDLEIGVGATPVPAGLIVDVASGGDIPALTSASVPDVESLDSFSYGSNAAVSATTQFNWTPSTSPGSLLTISTATGNGFFLDTDAARFKITCLVPDTGSFSFPADVQAQLGADFSGTAPGVSRLAVNPVLVNTTVFYVIRESFHR